MGKNLEKSPVEDINVASVVSELVQRSREAMKIFNSYSQEDVDEVVQAVAWAIYKPELTYNNLHFKVEHSGDRRIETVLVSVVDGEK